jgi:hypothetical protein
MVAPCEPLAAFPVWSGCGRICAAQLRIPAKQGAVSFGEERFRAAESCRFGLTVRFVPAVVALKCAPRVVPVWSEY